MTSLNLAKGRVPPCKCLSTGSGKASDRAGEVFWRPRFYLLRFLALPCPPLRSLMSPTCKTGSQDELIRGSFPARMCHDFRRCGCHLGPSLPHRAPCQAPSGPLLEAKARGKLVRGQAAFTTSPRFMVPGGPAWGIQAQGIPLISGQGGTQRYGLLSPPRPWLYLYNQLPWAAPRRL